MNTVTLSVVIPTVGRQEILPGVISALCEQTQPPDQIVIVDQTEQLSPTLSTDSRIVYIHHDIPSTPTARNLGVQAATGDIVLFLDDDIELPQKDLIENVLRFFEHHASYAGCALSIIDKNAKLNKENQRESNHVMQVTRSGKVLPFSHGPSQDVRAPRGGGVAYRRDVIVRCGGFDQRFVGNAMREETDFSIRVVTHVGPIRFVPELEIIHLALGRGGSRRTDRKQWYRDFFANELLFQLTHAPHRFLPLFFIRKIRPILACMFWYGKGRPSWVTIPFKGFREGYERYNKGFYPFPFDA